MRRTVAILDDTLRTAAYGDRSGCFRPVEEDASETLGSLS